MISEKQRRRALARAKYERQQAKRTAMQKRSRQLTAILGTVTVVVLIAFAGWGVHHFATTNSNTPNAPAITYETPTNTGITTIFSPPASGATSGTGPTSGSPTTGSPSNTSSSQPTTAPETTGASR